MIEWLSTLPKDIWYAIGGAIGGIMKLVIGVESSTRLQKVASVFVIALPIGWSAGHIIGTAECIKLPWLIDCVPLQDAAVPVAIVFGIGALGIVRKVAKDGPLSLITTIFKR